jgi:tetratricopeptide (TPR) repeat protein
MQELIAERLVNSGDLNGAAEHYRRAIALDPYLPGAHFELAEALLEAAPNQRSAQDDAEKELALAQKIDGDGPKIECKLGRVAFLRGEMDGALSHYQRAYELNSSKVEANLGIARILMSQNNAAAALPYLQRAVDGDPLNEEAHYRLAMADKALQKKEEAQQELRLFQEIKESKAKLIDLDRQMNRTAPRQEEIELPKDQ